MSHTIGNLKKAMRRVWRKTKVPLKSTLKSTLKGTQKIIVDIISDNPNVTIPEIAERLKLNPRGIAKHFKILQEKGLIRRVGPDKGGHWEVIENN